MTEQISGRPSLRDLVREGDFGRAVLTPEFADMDHVDQLRTILTAIDTKRNKLAEQVNLTERTSALINSLGIVARTISRIVTISADTDLSTGDKKEKIQKELEELHKGSQQKQLDDSASV